MIQKIASTLLFVISPTLFSQGTAPPLANEASLVRLGGQLMVAGKPTRTTATYQMRSVQAATRRRALYW